MIRQLGIKIRLANQNSLLHNSRQDCRELAGVCNRLIDKVNELTRKVNELEGNEKHVKCE